MRKSKGTAALGALARRIAGAARPPMGPPGAGMAPPVLPPGAAGAPMAPPGMKRGGKVKFAKGGMAHGSGCKCKLCSGGSVKMAKGGSVRGYGAAVKGHGRGRLV